jgi:VWFA-related protein
MKTITTLRAAVTAAFAVAAFVGASAQEVQDGKTSFRFKTGVDLINVTATVVDGTGRFVSGLRQDDFRVYEDDRLQPISHFNSERVPVSLGIVLDTSGSMDGEKMMSARRALERFLFELLGPDDEVFLYRFAASPELVHGWTQDRRAIMNELNRIRPRGATAMYDAVAEAMPLMQSARHRKKALLIISDGNDTSSRTDVRSLQALIRDTEALIYAIGIDAQPLTFTQPRSRSRWPWNFTLPIRFDQGRPVPRPFPIPGRRNPPMPPPGTPRGPVFPPRYPTPPQPGGGYASPRDERVNVAALRDMTDDSGGRTEIIRSANDLEQATAWIADELSKQYYLGYPAAAEKDGRWHTIRVEVQNANYRVRARRGYVATP